MAQSPASQKEENARFRGCSMGRLTSTLGNKPDFRRPKPGIQRKTGGVAQVKMCLDSGADGRPANRLSVTRPISR
ncbi:uncharacterized protein CLUP02_16186 [Colletotrichum lupini]|uniref:Uncharacterized protein n=2 Tax=Colletotrichum acutatum species complex TaxID=2707335 RepID=A0A9Q8T9N0_9PEZI|nr:uncharacterized protein CLUP02_16186 [Colletotrichum lupini]XP_060311921.1 uncharacterized protein CCOS01_09061 [Colletotrichum costaricense]KAK1523974.1 hypothetical protein CCOS01_09061 [Colletotrichum costaricense]UQC90656.1 hypothetical protein CLUP02_16186 [Colletotrichum lupini]